MWVSRLAGLAVYVTAAAAQPQPEPLGCGLYVPTDSLREQLDPAVWDAWRGVQGWVDNRHAPPAIPAAHATSFEVNAKIVDFAASVTLTQVFEVGVGGFSPPAAATAATAGSGGRAGGEHAEEEVIVVVDIGPGPTVMKSVSYLLPLDARAAVHAFRAVIDGTRVIEGEVFERRAAQEMYDRAVSRGETAFLLAQDAGDIFRVSMGNVDVGATVAIEVSYITDLEVINATAARFALPTTIAPRYTPYGGNSVTGSTMDIAPGKGARVRVDLDVQIASGVAQLVGVTHPVQDLTYTSLFGVGGGLGGGAAMGTPLNHNRARGVSYLKVPLSGDFVVELHAGLTTAPLALLEASASLGSHAAVVSYVPQLAADAPDAPPVEVVFVVDRSGSMFDAWKIPATRALLRRTLSGLPGRVSVNIVDFGSGYTPLFDQSRRLGDSGVTADVLAHVDAEWESLGGTEVLAPLEHVLGGMRRVPSADGGGAVLPLVVVLITDGQVSNTNEVVALGSRHGDVVFHCVGVGDAVSRALVDGLAGAGRGRATYMVTQADVTTPVAVLLGVLSHGMLTEVALHWRTAQNTIAACEAAPAATPPVGYNNRFVAYCIFNTNDLPQTVVFAATTPQGSRVQFASPVLTAPPPSHGDGAFDTVHLLAARRLLFDARENKTRSVALSLTYQLASAYASLLAVEKLPDGNSTARAEGAPTKVDEAMGLTRTMQYGAGTATLPSLLLLLLAVAVGLGVHL